VSAAVHPTLRHYPKDDPEFATDVSDAVEVEEGDVEAVLQRLRMKYSAVRIAERNPLANDGGGPVWYCYRDGKLIQTSDGAGAMRLWTPLERETRRSLDLIECSATLMRQGRAAAAYARATIEATSALLGR
jgi:hypothetical protein